jgi:hypothetical protein
MLFEQSIDDSESFLSGHLAATCSVIGVV